MTTIGVRISNVLYWVFYLIGLFVLFWLICGGVQLFFQMNLFSVAGLVATAACFVATQLFWIIPQYLITGSIQVLSPRLSFGLLALTLLSGIGIAVWYVHENDEQYAAKIKDSSAYVVSSERNCKAFEKLVSSGAGFIPNSRFIESCKYNGYLPKNFFSFDEDNPFADIPSTRPKQ